MLTWHSITLHLIFVLYVGPDDGLINSKCVACASERESKLGFD